MNKPNQHQLCRLTRGILGILFLGSYLAPNTLEAQNLPNLVIAKGEEFTLSGCDNRFSDVMVHGVFRLDKQYAQRCPQASLYADNIIVHGGKFEIGTEIEPYVGNIEITLTGTESGAMGQRAFGVMAGGVLELHGISKDKISWTQVSKSVAVGDTSLHLSQAVNWQSGDRIVLASSSVDAFESETFTVESVDASGQIVEISPAARFEHFGEIESYDGRLLDMRAEVGLLSRNIVIQGAEDSVSTRIGGHIMVMNESPRRRPVDTSERDWEAKDELARQSLERQGYVVPTDFRPIYLPQNLSQAHVEGVELRRMGQMGNKGRYSFHWHMVDNGSGQYFRNSSIHTGFQRAVNVHATDYTTVENNVAFDIFNHMYAWAEDGDEILNVFRNNLGVLQKVPPHWQNFAFYSKEKSGRHFSSQDEHRAGVFWGKNPLNVLVGNHAAGSWEGTGFFYDGDGSNIGRMVETVANSQLAQQYFHEVFGDYSPSASPYAIKADSEVCLFRNNTAHSTYRSPRKPGGEFYPTHSTGWGIFVKNMKRKGDSRKERIYGQDFVIQCTLNGFTGYKMSLGAGWLENGTTIANSIVGDSKNAWFLFDADVLNAVVVGETGNTLGGTKIETSADRPNHGALSSKTVEVSMDVPRPNGILLSPGERGIGSLVNAERIDVTTHFENVTCIGVPNCISSSRHWLSQKAITLEKVRCDTEQACFTFSNGKHDATGSAIDIDGSVTGIAGTEIFSQDADYQNPAPYAMSVETNVSDSSGAQPTPVVFPPIAQPTPVVIPPTPEPTPVISETPQCSISPQEARQLKRLERKISRLEKRLEKMLTWTPEKLSKRKYERRVKRFEQRISRYSARLILLLQKQC